MEQEVNKKKLFVGSLNYDTTEETLKEFFSGAGTVESAVIIMDKMSGRSKGFGFVEMSTEEEAKKAVEMFDYSCWVKSLLKAIKFNKYKGKHSYYPITE